MNTFYWLMAYAMFMHSPARITEKEMEVLQKLNARFIHNFVTNDVPSHQAIIHEEFVHISSSGKWVGREDYLKQWHNGFDPEKIVYWDYRFERITIVGTTALVRSVNKYIILSEGKETTGMSQYTDTYVKQGDTWKCIQAQITAVSPENYPPDHTIVKKYIKGKLQ